MNKKCLIITVVLLLLAEIFSSCGEKTNNEFSDSKIPNDESSFGSQKPDSDSMLQGTKWRLEGLVDAKTGALKVFEPEDCDKCYRLTFDTDTTFATYSSANVLSGIYIVDYTENFIRFSDLIGTELAERGDGILYVNALHDIYLFSCKENELKLYYSENKNYLLFKSLE